MPRYVILEHDHPHVHWDLMLEAGERLRTWRLASAPEFDKAVVAEASFDHRLAYLEYEGPVSGGRGRVTRWDHGSYTLQADEAERLVLHLDGQRLKGTVTLSRGDGQWLFQIEESSFGI
jgi:hypothetical protein